jgi:ribosomal protein L9
VELLLHSKNSAVRYEGLFVSLGFAAAFLLREAKALGQEKGRRRQGEEVERKEKRKWREKKREE